MIYRCLGKQKLKVAAVGYGCPTFQGKLGAAEVLLTPTDIAEIDKLFPRQGAAAGARHEYDRSGELNI